MKGVVFFSQNAEAQYTAPGAQGCFRIADGEMGLAQPGHFG